jgi:uncharacterized protein YqgC (DUF456 family)
MDWLLYTLLLLILLTGVALNLFTLPGNWIMFLALVLYDWATGWRHIHWAWLAVLLVIALAAEVIEFTSAGKGAKQLGGTIWGTVGALLGALVGAIFLTGLIPVPVIGTIAGILIGTFLGAMLAELMFSGKEVGRSAMIGYGAAKGRLYGTLVKFGFGCLIFLLSLIAALPTGKAKAKTTTNPAPVVPPTTAPAPPVLRATVPATAPTK